MTRTASKLVRELTDRHLHGAEALDALRRFAGEFGWRPSDQLDHYAGTESFCNGHLVVEHGFDRTAVVSFLRSDTPYSDLETDQRRRLLELSYNNLVDWHLFPETSGMRVVFNRTDPPLDSFFPATLSEDVWRADAFDRLTDRRPNPNVKALDDALIDTVSFWKRAIQSDLGSRVTLSQISAIINSVILVRAREDYGARTRLSSSPLLLTLLDDFGPEDRNAYKLISRSLDALGLTQPPPWLREMLHELRAFDHWDSDGLRELVGNFYRSRFSKYRYNFDLISKHALSRIYEHYVSVLRDPDSSELTLFRGLPDEIQNKDLGSVYTPQYVARFFARYVREHRTPRAFRHIRSIDPACGSGMFLRTLLELQCDPANENFSAQFVGETFGRTLGLDIDPNACQAATLSLSLLHLVLTGEFPKSLEIKCTEAIEYLQSHKEAGFDVVIANPPFIKWDGLPPAIREQLSSFLLDQGFGKQDLYLAFLKASMEHTLPGGVLCFVLPHSFLLSKSAEGLRRQLHEQFSIRILADLSEVPVFEQTGAYVILLIAERTPERQSLATVLKCRAFVGAALQDALSGRMTNEPGYEIFEVEQETFARDRWNLLSANDTALRRVIESHPRLDEFVDVRQGLITGRDEVFVRPMRSCPKAERMVWRPLLPDREMKRVGVPDRQTTAVFMPFDEDGSKINEDTLRRRYPETWRYLLEFRKDLEIRSTVTKNGRPWWEPAWPRSPEKLFVPKIVTPHLVLLPRFSIDLTGKFAVSRSPYLVPKSDGGPSILKVICAMLNSAVGHWQLATSSHKYSRGYLMLEVKTLREIRIPHPAKMPFRLTRAIVQLVDRLAATPDDSEAIIELDHAVYDAFGLSPALRAIIERGA